jgi:hypothetical protein
MARSCVLAALLLLASLAATQAHIVMLTDGASALYFPLGHIA